MSNSRPAITIDSATVILAFTAAAYAIAFAYERAYLTAFGLPAHLVEVDLKSVLLAGAGIMGALVVLSMLSLVLAFIPSSWPIQIRDRFTRGLAQPAFLAIVFALMGAHPKAWVNLAAWSTIGVLLVISILGARWDMKKYRKEGDAHLKRLEVFDRANPGAVWRWGETQFGFEGMRALFIFWLALVAATLVGGAHAQRQQLFLVSNARPPCIMIREYRGTLLCAVVDESLRTLTGNYIFTPTSLSERSFSLRSAGPFESVANGTVPR